MFRSRTSARKPDDELLADFRQQFPEVSTGVTEPAAPAISQATTAVFQPIINAPVNERAHIETAAFRDMDPTPRAVNDPWRFTPSLLDANAFTFNPLTPGVTGVTGVTNVTTVAGVPGIPGVTGVAGPQAYYPPTPGGSGTLLPPQAVEIVPPSAMAITTGLETPLSVPTTLDIIQPSIEVPNLAGFPTIDTLPMAPFEAFVHQAPPPQPGFVPTVVPTEFVHHDTGYETMDHDGSPMDSDPSEERIPTIASALHPQQLMGIPMTHPLPASAEKFRFHSTLNAPTAMVKHSTEIPVTYLNKGQAYTLSIVDTGTAVPVSPGTRYRTYVRISFEDEQQRQKPGVCWSLWKEGRGTNEAHQRGGRLQAVEYVEAGQPAEGDDKRTRVELESSSFDGFSVVWTPGSIGAAEVNIPVRFNFLSTDFSHSKGVKGIPVRLCAKTSLFSADQLPSPPDAAPETCYCKVKLFRDHGAERKLSNDVAHVKKSIDKLKQQIAQAESGLKEFKRKRSGAVAKGGIPAKHKHKRTWSMSSASSAGGAAPRLTLEDDLHFKLQTLQDMFTSTRPVSVLYLRGDELDDPDLHPVSLQGESLPGKADFLREGSNWQARSTHSSVAGSLVSPSPSSLSLASQASAIGPGLQWQNFDSTGVKRVENPTTISKTEEDGTLSGWIEALGVDPTYRPPPERPAKPVACFYIAYSGRAETGKKEYHRAIYLSSRTLRELNGRIAAKWGLDASLIVRTIHVTKPTGIEVEIDDDFVQELREGQDMQLEIEDVVEQPSIKRDWEMSIDDGPEGPAAVPTGLALRLLF
ncbi:CP2 transcription factor domain-containing protein [Trichoderma camerunense]